MLFASALLLAAQSPLTHSAPWLGHPLDVDLTGLIPGAAVALYYSPSAASIPTPFGLLELDPAGAVQIGAGVADPQGDLSFQFTLPQTVGLAEAPAHLQALAVAGVGGFVNLTDAAHLRLLGSRVYAGQDIFVPELPGFVSRIGVHSSPSLAPVFSVGLGELQQEAQVFLSADASMGAVVSGSQITRFDNFFGASSDSLAFDGIGGVSLDASGQDLLVYAFDTPLNRGEVLRVPLAVGFGPTALGIFGEQGVAGFDPSGTTAYLPDLPTPGQQARVSQVDLGSGTTLAQLTVGPVGHAELEWLAVDGQRLTAGTRTIDPLLQGTCAVGWIDLPVAAPATLIPLGSGDTLELDLRLGASGQLLFHALDWPFAGPTSATVSAYLLDPSQPAPQALSPIALPPFAPEDLSHAVDLGATVWMADRCCDLPPNGDGHMRLFELDPLAATLTDVSPQSPFVGYLDQQYVAMTGTADFAAQVVVLAPSCPFACTPAASFRLRDAVSGSESLVPTGGWSTAWVEGVSIP